MKKFYYFWESSYFMHIKLISKKGGKLSLQVKEVHSVQVHVTRRKINQEKVLTSQNFKNIPMKKEVTKKWSYNIMCQFSEKSKDREKCISEWMKWKEGTKISIKLDILKITLKIVFFFNLSNSQTEDSFNILIGN